MPIPDLKGCRIVVLGGDARTRFYIPALIAAGATVRAVGFERLVGLIGCELSELSTALAWADVVILPMAGIDRDGRIAAQFSDQPLTLCGMTSRLLRPGTLVLTGVAGVNLHELARTQSWKLVEIADIDELAVLNSVPSAEGALQMAMELSDITIHHSNCFVLGFGRTGTTLARALFGLGATVTVVARNQVDLARASASGYEQVAFADYDSCFGQADFIFNTVPAPVLGECVLQLTKPEVVIVDIASQPGGVDYQAAARLGRVAKLAPSLPGRVAPRTAGLILGRLLPGIIKRQLVEEA